LVFQWLRGGETPSEDFGDPTTTEDYKLCVYGSSGLGVALEIPAASMCSGRPCWSALGQPDSLKGYRYRDRALSNDGVNVFQLRGGDEGQAKLTLKAKGAGLSLPNLSTLALGMTVQILSEGGECWDAEIGSSTVSSALDRMRARVELAPPVRGIGVTGDGTRLFVPGCGRTCVRRVAMPGGSIEASHFAGETLRSIDLAPDGTRVVVVPDDKFLRVLDANLAVQREISAGSLITAGDFSHDSARFRFLFPKPQRLLQNFNVSTGAAAGTVALAATPHDVASLAACSDCAAVTLPAFGSLQIVRNGAAAETVDVGMTPRFVASNRPSSGDEIVVVTSRGADTVTLVNLTTSAVTGTLGLHDPVDLDASTTRAFVLFANGARVAVISLAPGGTFGQLQAVVTFPQRLDAIRVARGTGVAYALARTHDKVWTLDPALLPADGSTVAAPAATQIN
jgi:hypothetical protein